MNPRLSPLSPLHIYTHQIYFINTILRTIPPSNTYTNPHNSTCTMDTSIPDTIAHGNPLQASVLTNKVTNTRTTTNTIVYPPIETLKISPRNHDILHFQHSIYTTTTDTTPRLPIHETRMVPPTIHMHVSILQIFYHLLPQPHTHFPWLPPPSLLIILHIYHHVRHLTTQCNRCTQKYWWRKSSISPNPHKQCQSYQYVTVWILVTSRYYPYHHTKTSYLPYTPTQYHTLPPNRYPTTSYPATIIHICDQYQYSSYTAR